MIIYKVSDVYVSSSVGIKCERFMNHFQLLLSKCSDWLQGVSGVVRVFSPPQHVTLGPWHHNNNNKTPFFFLDAAARRWSKCEDRKATLSLSAANTAAFIETFKIKPHTDVSLPAAEFFFFLPLVPSGRAVTATPYQSTEKKKMLRSCRSASLQAAQTFFFF